MLGIRNEHDNEEGTWGAFNEEIDLAKVRDAFAKGKRVTGAI